MNHMKKITALVSIALLCLLPQLAFATLGIAEAIVNNVPNATTTVSCAVGDLMLVGTEGSTPGTVTVTGSVQGAYTQVTLLSGGSFDYIGSFYKVCTTTGTETITATGSATTNRLGFIHLSAFTHTATVKTTDKNQATATSTAMNSGTVTTSVNNEYFFGVSDQATVAVTGASFAMTAGNNSLNIWLSDPASTGSISPYVTSGSSAVLTGTMGSSNQWIVAIVGFYDAGASCTNTGWSITGAEAIPNGSTGSYWGPLTFGTPNCSGTPNFWRPLLGTFGPT